MSNAFESVFYEGCEIVARPFQIEETKKWTTDIEILKHSGAGVKVTSYSAGNVYDSQDKAIKYCFLFGKKILDGDINVRRT